MAPVEITSQCSQVLAALRETEAQTRRARKQNEGLLKEQKALRQRVAALVEAQEQLKRDSEIEVAIDHLQFASFCELCVCVCLCESIYVRVCCVCVCVCMHVFMCVYQSRINCDLHRITLKPD